MSDIAELYCEIAYWHSEEPAKLLTGQSAADAKQRMNTDRTALFMSPPELGLRQRRADPFQQ